MNLKQINHWEYEGKPLLEKPNNAKAFIYRILHIPSGKFYIGYKLFQNKITTKLSKKALLSRVDKRASKKKVVHKEKWIEYCGSCTDVEYKRLWKESPQDFKRVILQVVYPGDWSEKYYEKKWMILLDWESPKCFNKHFDGKVFKPK